MIYFCTCNFFIERNFKRISYFKIIIQKNYFYKIIIISSHSYKKISLSSIAFIILIFEVGTVLILLVIGFLILQEFLRESIYFINKNGPVVGASNAVRRIFFTYN